jgi:hypothetical protein
MKMSEDDKLLMARYEITCEPKMIYSYKQHRYEKLKDALNYAQNDTTQDQESSPNTPA